MREVLLYWLESAVDPHPPHWKTIVTALRSSLVNEIHLADQLESKYCAPEQHMREEEGIVITTLFCCFGFSLQFSNLYNVKGVCCTNFLHGRSVLAWYEFTGQSLKV